MDGIQISDNEAQSITIGSYNKHADEYFDKVANNSTREVAYWPGVERFLKLVPENETIFEIGSGSGRDAQRLEALGYTVQRSDITEAFVSHLRSEGYTAVTYNVLASPTNEKQSVIFANAVFLHFTDSQFITGLRNVHSSLIGHGLFCIGMKLGTFDGWREKGLGGKRYFKFWQVEALHSGIRAADFDVLDTFVTPDEDFTIMTCRRM